MNDLSKNIRRKIIDLLYKHKACHLGSCMSCVEILSVLYFEIMRSEDKFILSKGHAAAALYTVLAEKGIIDWNDLYEKYYEKGGDYWGLVHHTVPGVI
jgi:transketolase